MASPSLASPSEQSALRHYFIARVLDLDGGRGALGGYDAALTAEPDNKYVALRAYRRAIQAGDEKLAVRAAIQLENARALPADARLLLFGERLSRGDLAGAKLMIERIEEDGNLAFLVPLLRAWAGIAARDRDVAANLEAASRQSQKSVYASEQQALILILRGDVPAGLSIVKTLETSEQKVPALKLAGAAMLVRAKNNVEAKRLLAGNDPSLLAAERLIDAKIPLPDSIKSASQGLAWLYARVAADLLNEKAPAFALTIARFSRFLDDGDGYARLIEGQALFANGQNESAFESLSGIAANNPYRVFADDTLTRVYERLGKIDAGLAILEASTSSKSARPVDFVRLGEFQGRAGNFTASAVAYDNAIALILKSAGSPTAPWSLLMLKGVALQRAGDWAAAQSVLRQAIETAPDQAAPLNQLGYSLLERRENIGEALALIKRASVLRPDDSAITDSLGWAYFLSGNTDHAVALLERAVAAEPLESIMSEHLGDAYWGAGRRVDARYAWRAALLNAEKDAEARLAEKIDIGVTVATAAR